MGHVIEIFPYSRHRQPKLILWERYADVVESGWKCNEHSAAARKMLESVENELPYPCVEFLCTCVPLNFVMSDPLLTKFHVSMRVFLRTLIIDSRKLYINESMRVAQFGPITCVFS